MAQAQKPLRQPLTRLPPPHLCFAKMERIKGTHFTASPCAAKIRSHPIRARRSRRSSASSS